MNLFKSAILTLAATVAAGAWAADNPHFEVVSASPMSGSVIRQFNYTTMVVSLPGEGEEVSAVEILEPGGVYYSVESYSDLASIGVGFPMTVAKTKAGDLRIQMTNEAIAQAKEAGMYPIVQAGRYILRVDEDAFRVVSESGKVYYSPEIEFVYDLLPEAPYTANPAPDSKVSVVRDMISLQFDTFGKVAVTDDFAATVISDSGLEVALGAPTAMENMLMIPLANGVIDAPGEYELILKAGSVRLFDADEVADQVNPEISYKFNVLGMATPMITEMGPTPGIVEELGSVYVVYNMVPRVNPDCKETLKLYRDEEVILEYDNTSRNVQFSLDDEDPGTVCFVFVRSVAEIYRESGTYRLEVPAGFLKFDSGDQTYYTDPIEYTYEIPRKWDFTIDPIPGNVESIKEFTITFPDAVSIVQNELVADEDGDGIVKLYCWEVDDVNTPDVTITGNVIKFVVPEQTTPSKYLLMLPYGAFTLTDAEGNKGENQTLSFDYYISNIPMPDLDPRPGKYTELGEIELTLTEGLIFSSWPASQKARLNPVKKDGSLGSAVGFWKRSTPAMGNKSVTLVPDAEYDLAPGDYAFVIGKSTFGVDVPEGSKWTAGFLQNELRFYYTIIADESAEMTPEYADGYEFTGKIEKFVLNFNKATEVEVNPEGDAATVVTAEGNDLESEVTLSPLSSGKAIEVAVNPALVYNGGYTFEIPAAALLINGKKSPAYTLTYNLSGGQTGVGMTGAEAQKITVVGIDGTVVAREADRSVLETLPAGLYIVNGKKVIVK